MLTGILIWVGVGVVLGLWRTRRDWMWSQGDDIAPTVLVWAIAWPLFLPLLFWGKR